MIEFFWNIITTCIAHPFYSTMGAFVVYGSYQSGVWQGRIIERDIAEADIEKKDQRHLNQPY